MASALKQMRFESYKGMSRPAMYAGVPILPLVGLLLGAIATGVLAAYLFSWMAGLASLVPFFVSFGVLRLIYAIYGQYLNRVRFAWRRLRLNLKYGRPLLLSSQNLEWSRAYAKRFAQQRDAHRQTDTATEIPRR